VVLKEAIGRLAQKALLLSKIMLPDMEELALAPASAVAATAAPSDSPALRLTYEDYAALTPPDSGNYELHDGKIIAMPSPTPLHQDIAVELTTRLRAHSKSLQLGKVYTAPLDTLFDDINTFQPDVLFIAKERSFIIGPKKIEGAPDFVVEIQSEGNSPKEMNYKQYIYATFMVREYWVIHLKKETITQYLNEEGEFRQAGIFSKEQTVKSQVISGFQVSLAELMA
jgi:Uma2 family endonuclease